MIDEYFFRGNNYYDEKNWEKALDSYKKSLGNVTPLEKDCEVLYNIGVCYLKQGNFKEASKYFKMAVKLKSDYKYYFNLAYSYTMLKQNKKALIYFNTSWALNPDDADSEKGINIILESLSEFKANKEYTQPSLSIKTIFVAIHRKNVGFEILKYSVQEISGGSVKEEFIKSIECKRRNTKKYNTLVKKIKQDYSVEKIILL